MKCCGRLPARRRTRTVGSDNPKATGNFIPGNLRSLKFPEGIPGNFEGFPKLSFFWILMVPYYVKPVFFELHVTKAIHKRKVAVTHVSFVIGCQFRVARGRHIDSNAASTSEFGTLSIKCRVVRQ